MNVAEGVVERLEGPDAWVRSATAAPACGSCTQKAGCSSAAPGVASEVFGAAEKRMMLRLPNSIGARPGDAVQICAAEGLVLRAVWRAYGLPLLLGVGAAVGLFALTGKDAAALLGLIAGLLIGVVLLRRKGLEAKRKEPILSMRFKSVSIINCKDSESC